MQAMLQFFSAEHLDPGKVINKRPQILQMDTKKLASNLLFLQLLPIKVWKGVESRPELLYFPCHIIQTKLDALTHLGFVLKRFPALARIINAQPSVLGRNTDRTLRPTITLITKDMGRTLGEINQNPACLIYSLEKRIKPRWRYMMAFGTYKGLA